MSRSTVQKIIARSILSSAAAGLVILTGCSETSSDPSRIGETQAESPSAVAPAKTDLSVPSGSVLRVEFERSVSSADSRPGEQFTASVVEPVYVDGRVAIGAGATVTGRVVEVEPAKKIGGRAKLNLEFTSVKTLDGSEWPLSATFHDQAKSQTKKDAATIGGSTAGGAILGRIMGHQKGDDAEGTTIGAIVGAAVGTAIAASNTGEEVTIAAGTEVPIELLRPIRMTVTS